ncbi:MAG: DNA polymerase III subunit beta [Candidatus Aminicenantes bacterium]|nr:DNA polymerase III subunit beta [Candidatus Aminicenantes bacterium]
MKFTVARDIILEDIQLLQGIVEKRNTMPILANILMKAEEGRVEMTGTDLEVGMRTSFEASVEESGAITVPGKKLFEIVKSLPEGQAVSMTERGDQILEVVSGESEFKIVGLAKDDYPAVPEPTFENSLRIPVEDMQDMIDGVFFAIAQEQRYYLNGALFVVKGKKRQLVSTDGHRLAYAAKESEEGSAGRDVRVIIAKKTLAEIRKFGPGVIEFDQDENNLFFRCGARTIISRIIESKFPNFDAVIPKDNPHIALLSKETFLGAVRRVSLFSAERSKGVKFSLEKNRIRLYSSNPEIGEARDKIDVVYAGANLEIGFNAQYILDYLMTVRKEKVRFELKDDNSAAMMRPEGEERMSSLYVLMPMKL